ncbi:MAG TPA: hypothetical protein ENI66_02145 [Candidatus Yonathbacteria bacterium]|nr:hypothetical protein [Candidatus Yonathbacteria bacterium]
MKLTAHIRIVQHPNPDRRTYHVTRQVSKVHLYKFGVDELSGCSFDEKDPGDLAKKLAKGLERVPGINSGSLNAYEIDVGKGTAFDWEDIGHFIVGQIVKHVFPDCVGETIEISTTLHYMEGDYSRKHDYCKREKVSVKFWSKMRPHVYVEHLFTIQAIRKVVDNNVAGGVAQTG